MLYSASAYYTLPPEPGAYLFLNQNSEVIYVGKAKDLKKRVSSYFLNPFMLLPKTKILVDQIEKIKIIRVDSEIESLLLEANLIQKYRPKYNIRLTDGKAYPLIRITIKDEYPKVLFARRKEDKNSLYFGPFPNARTLRFVVREVRKIFPFQSVKNHAKKICLYNHLNLCPCPPVYASKDFKKKYQKNIQYLLKFLQGQKVSVLKDLEKERNVSIKKEQFEKASEIQKKIGAILYITNPTRKPFEYEINPNLSLDLREKELEELRKVLTKAGLKVLSLERIECFDVSNILGLHAVGSMVVFSHGEKDLSAYRRFKINSETIGPNDFLMMEEIIHRRLRHSEWNMPGLLIVDGGKGQISSAMKAFKNTDKSIPIIGLAKKEETIITSDFKEISLPKSSPALQLIIRIRDEAHRFAITYHKKLRTKMFLQN